MPRRGKLVTLPSSPLPTNVIWCEEKTCKLNNVNDASVKIRRKKLSDGSMTDAILCDEHATSPHWRAK